MIKQHFCEKTEEFQKMDEWRAKMDKDIEYIKKNVEEIVQMIPKIREMDKTLYGEREERGLVSKVADIQTYIIELKAVLSFLKWVIGISGLTNMVLIIKFFLN